MTPLTTIVREEEAELYKSFMVGEYGKRRIGRAEAKLLLRSSILRVLEGVRKHISGGNAGKPWQDFEIMRYLVAEQESIKKLTE